MSKLAKALTAAAGNAGESLYVEDVFSTYLYTGGLSSPNVIQTNIDLAGEGGLVWTKNRTSATSNQLTDTVSGYRIESDDTAAGEASQSNVLFNSDGHSLSGYSSFFNGGGDNYASWTFRKAEKFFDVVTYTGTGTTRTVSHNLGSTPAVIIIKRLDAAVGWPTYHEANGNTGLMYLNTTAAKATSTSAWGSTSPTATEFTVGTNVNNISGGQFVAYLFASDAGGFGDDGSESIIKCGSFTLDGSGNASIDCGFEPQWVLAKRTDGVQDWYLTDMMRGMAQTTNGSGTLSPNLSDAEYTYNRPKATATGFDYVFIPNTSYIYIAIRRPMKTPESGTEVFAVDNGNGTSGFNSGFPVDMGWRFSNITTAAGFQFAARLNAKKNLFPHNTDAESNAGGFTFDSNTGWGTSIGINSTDYSWMFKRATGFFDVVAYTGTGSAQAVNHNLGVAPELIIEKRRDGVAAWLIYHDAIGNTKYLQFTTAAEATSAAAWNNTSPTSTQFTVGTGASVSGGTHIAYLFATLDGVSKVGSYTGNGSNQTIDCGFSAGARFVLIKGTTLSSNWVVFDSERGITVNNDPVLYLNSTIAEFTDSVIDIEPDSSGFIVNSGGNVNASGETYIFLAIA